VPPGDAAGFAGALAHVLTDDARAATLGHSARATVVAGLTWDRFVERIQQLLDAAATRPDGRSPRG
jgi:glycosyltransferase involved in cell wall biosynthesis